MLTDLSVGELINLADQSVQELTVMTYHDYSSVKRLYSLLKHIL